jgi:hypothetical protein
MAFLSFQNASDIRIDHFRVYFSSPFGHADSKIDIRKGNEGDDKSVISTKSDREVVDSDSKMNEYGYDLEGDLIQEGFPFQVLKGTCPFSRASNATSRNISPIIYHLGP